MSLKGRAILVAAVICAASTLNAADVRRPDVPQPFCVCVTTSDAAGVSRLDECFSFEQEAKDRRAAILSDGWITIGDEDDREDAYPPHSIVKATVDPTLVNESICQPPPSRNAIAERLQVPRLR